MIDFELIKGRIKQYKLSSLVQNILETLNKMQEDKERMYPFWNLLTLLKWSYLHTEDSVLRKNVTPHDIQHLSNLIESFESKYNQINFKNRNAVRKSFRIFAYQQFPYQDHFFNWVIHRQLVLYTQLYSSFDIQKEFKEKTGLEIVDFLKYCNYTYLYFNLHEVDEKFNCNGALNGLYFDTFKEKFDINQLQKFIKILTITNKNDFQNLHKLNNEILQLYETNFFITKPFIQFLGEIRLPHKAIFIQTISHFIYSYLKSNSTFFPEEFGKRLEKYIQLGLEEVNIKYENETTLKTKYELQKVCDFLLDDNILIECKAIELHPRSGVIREGNIIAKELASTIVKAYLQMLSTANEIDNNKEWYGIIITYKEMYLGFGNDAWEEFLKEPIEKELQSTSINLSILPPKNLFFFSIDNWDYTIQAIKEQLATDLKEVLLKGYELSSIDDPQQSVFMMEQVLRKCFTIGRLKLSYLEKVKDLIDFTA